MKIKYNFIFIIDSRIKIRMRMNFFYLKKIYCFYLRVLVFDIIE